MWFLENGKDSNLKLQNKHDNLDFLMTIEILSKKKWELQIFDSRLQHDLQILNFLY